jgi:hypothetical protein
VAQSLGIEGAGPLGVEAGSTPAGLGFNVNMSGHLLARAVIIPTAEIPAA